MNDILNVIPRPVSARPLGGFCRFSGSIEAAGKWAAECGVFSAQTQTHPHLRGIPVSENGAAVPGAALRCVPDESLAEEAYRLRIESGGITLAGSSGSGIYHGLQTLRQIVLSAGGGDIPCADIEDQPRFSWRGFMLDCSRHFFTAAFIKKIIDALSLHHINKFHWHLTDDQGWRLPVPSYPLLVEKGAWRKETRFGGRREGGFYTAEEIRSVVQFAAARHVEIVPEVDLPGHTLSALASYPELGCTGGPYETEDRYGIFEDVLCAGNDGVFDFTEAVFGAMADLFPSPFVHIGGDEVRFDRWEACPKCGKRLAETGLSKPRELQSWITFRLAAMLSGRGKTPIGWDEILEDSPKYPLPSEAVIMSWRGREGGLDAVRRGRRVIMSPCTEGCYLDYKHSDDPGEPGQLGVSSLKSIYSMNPVSLMNEEEAALVLGGQANLWTEIVYAGKIAEYMIFPRICALAETLWNPPGGHETDFEDFSRRLSVHRERLDTLGLLQYRGGE